MFFEGVLGGWFILQMLLTLRAILENFGNWWWIRGGGGGFWGCWLEGVVFEGVPLEGVSLEGVVNGLLGWEIYFFQFTVSSLAWLFWVFEKVLRWVRWIDCFFSILEYVSLWSSHLTRFFFLLFLLALQK